MASSDIESLIHEISHRSFDNEVRFQEYIIPKFVKELGYNPANLLYDVTLPADDQGTYTPDAVISRSSSKVPWLAIDAIYFPEDAQYIRRDGYNYQTDDYGISQQLMHQEVLLRQTGAKRVLVISNHECRFSRPSDSESVWNGDGVDISSFGKIDKFIDWLKPPESLPVEDIDWEITEEELISDEFSSIKTDEFKIRRNKVENASTREEKKRVYEEMADFLFSSIKCTTIKERNLYNRVGEIDLVIEYAGSQKYPIFDDYGRYILIECKNTSESVSSGQISKFADKMKESRINLGVIFAKNGISGEGEGAYARRKVHNLFQREGIAIAVINNNKLDQVLTGKTFYEILKQDLYELRLQIH